MKKIMILIASFLTATFLMPSIPSTTLIPTKPKAELISITKNVISKKEGIDDGSEATMAYIARVSNPANQANSNYARLLHYCIKKEHWSVFEHAYMTLGITTTLAIAAQILRHRSFTFQQFSQRYENPSELAPEIPTPQLRRQDFKNRQNSIDDLPPEIQAELGARIAEHNQKTMELYQDLLKKGVAKECARAVLPQATLTTLFMTGNARSWLHYIQLRTSPETQLEHREVALGCKEIFVKQFPEASKALGWIEPEAPLAR